MKRRNFIKGSAVLTAASATGFASASPLSPADKKEIYEMRIYNYTSGAGKSKVDNFYQKSLIPFLNKKGVKVGAFGEYSKNEPPVGYFLFIYPSIVDYQQIKNDLWKDKAFTDSSAEYFNTTAQTGAYFRFNSYLLEAFDGFPVAKIPSKERTLLELRTYESSNEEAGQRKIKMFNAEEIDLFKSVGLDLLYFGEILAGPKMPGLIYMVSYKSMEERDEKWKKFAESDEWKVMSKKPEYANSVSTVNKVFLVPLNYSQI